MPNQLTASLMRSGNGHIGQASAAQLAPETLGRLSEDLKDQWRCYRKQLRRCQRKFSEDAVHDLRVEARRLLSLLDLMAPFVSPPCSAKAQRRLKCHLDTFDDLRDAQVQLSHLRELRKRFSAARDFCRHVKKCQKDLCRTTRKRAERLKHKSLGRLIKTCRKQGADWAQQAGAVSANPLLIRGIGAAFSRTRELQSRIDPDDPRTIHRTRIAFKKFRYMLEALADHLPWVNDRLLERLRRHQALMGDIQDGEVMLRAFNKFARKQAAPAQPVVQFTRELLRRRRRMIRLYLDDAPRLQTFWPPCTDLKNLNGKAGPVRHSERRRRSTAR